MGSLEVLTKEELIGWIPENNPKIDEEYIAINVLHERQKSIWERTKEADDRFWEANEQIRKLLEEHSDGEVKPGMRLQRWFAAEQEKYNELDRERRAAQKEWRELLEQDRQISKRFMDLQQKRIDRFIGLTDKAIEQTAQIMRTGE